MASGKEIRTKIASVKSTQKITKAMEMVAATMFTLKRRKNAMPFAPIRQRSTSTPFCCHSRSSATTLRNVFTFSEPVRPRSVLNTM